MMRSTTVKPTAVIGAGVLGAAVALALTREGVDVVLINDTPLSQNASGVAAGMLAPAMESALDSVSHGRFALLASARDLWPAFAEDLGPTGLDRCGSLLTAPSDVLGGVWETLNAQGARVQTAGDNALFTPEDWRLEPRLTLAAMLDGLQRQGGQVVAAQAASVAADHVVLSDGRRVGVGGVVLACGYGGQALAPELACLEPIKGQILRYPDVEMTEGPILRGPGGYVAPSRDGPVCGATMERGVADLAIDPEAIHRLHAQAVRLAPQLAGARPVARAGVRAATPDGLPLVGPSVREGVWLAAGARRDGWLIAPMVAASLVRQIVHGGPPDPLFDPSRYAS